MAGTHVHPGEFVRDELEARWDVDASRLIDVLNGTRQIDAPIATMLSAVFGTSSDFWLNLQANYDKDHAE